METGGMGKKNHNFFFPIPPISATFAPKKALGLRIYHPGMIHVQPPHPTPHERLPQPAALSKEPLVSVGVVRGQRLTLFFPSPYTAESLRLEGRVMVTIDHGELVCGEQRLAKLYLRPQGPECSFSVENVTIGIHFHWERQETQTFRGDLAIIVDGDQLQAINVLPAEQYLTSVISSEMSAHAGLELLKAHAVISRSWLLSQMERRARQGDGVDCDKPADGKGMMESDGKIVRWYDREDHKHFDVCADDHCQRYQGITRQTNPQVAEAIAATRGMLLTYDGEICDARFSKCCGGAVEEFQYCWENLRKPYLRALADNRRPQTLPNLTVEKEAERWIRTSPEAFCNTHDSSILAQVLNNYDQETTDFYRWQVSYTQEQLSQLIARKLGMDLGRIVDLLPLKRGRSGRICLLRIVGTHRTLDLGKELEIRRALSDTHLYSSAFVVDRHDLSADGIPARFTLTGAGWGHGVGLCQIGAAVMGARGYGYRDILEHYYPGAAIEQRWQ